MSQRCLRIKMADGREFFTSEANTSWLIEFSKTFKPDMAIVELESEPDDVPVSLLTLNQLASFIADNARSGQTAKYKIIETGDKDVFGKCRRVIVPNAGLVAEKRTLHRVTDIRKFLLQEFSQGKSVKVRDLLDKFTKQNLSVSSIYRHMGFVRREMEKQGKTLERVSVGEYRVT